MNEQRFEGLPMVLETPIDEGGDSGEKKKEDKGVWATEVKLLEGLVGMDKEGPEFRRFEEELAARGQEGREKEMGLFEKKKRKAEAAALKGEKEKKKKTEQKDEGSESEES